MAIDLRFIFAVIKINRDLERIGDRAMGIRRRTKDILQEEPIPLPVDCRLGPGEDDGFGGFPTHFQCNCARSRHAVWRNANAPGRRALRPMGAGL